MTERHKCTIVKVGTIDANGIARDWAFDGKDSTVVDDDAVAVCAGYTMDELRVIADQHQQDVNHA